MRRAWIACLLVSSAALAAEPGEYGYQWPLELDPEAGALRLTLTPEIYAHVYDPGLRDLEVFNAEGRAQPFGPVPRSETEASPARVELPWFALPARSAGDPAQSIRLRIERGAGGQLRRLDASLPSAPAAAERSDLLLDLSAHVGRVESVELEWAAAQRDVSARFRVSASDDLVSWSALVGEASVVELRQNGFELVRRRIDLPATQSPYLLLERSDGGAPLALERVRASLAPDAQHRPLEWLPARPRVPAPEPGVAEFQAPGPLRVERLDLDLAAPGSVARVEVLSRDRDDAPWVARAELTAFRLGGSSEARQQDVAIAATRDRRWRVVSHPPLVSSPALRLGYRPDEFVLLASGAGPFSLAGGSAVARRQDYPMALLVSELRSRQGSEWQLRDAGLGPLATLRGDAALVAPRAPIPWVRWLLWGVLVAAASLIVLLVLRLLRSVPEDPSRS